MKKKELSEKQVFTEFCEKIGLNFKEYTYVDSPDFVNKNNHTAFELTEYHKDPSVKGSNLRKIESSLEKIIANAKKKYKSKKKDTNSNVFFFPHYNVNFMDIGNYDKISSEIAEFIYLHNNQEIEITSNDLPFKLDKFFSHISIYNKSEFKTDNLWQTAEMSLVDVNIDSISEIIRLKEIKINDYKKHASSVSLLIYSSDIPCIGVPGIGRSSTCGSITNELYKIFYYTIFDSVYFFDRSKGEVLKLRCTQKLSVESG